MDNRYVPKKGDYIEFWAKEAGSNVGKARVIEARSDSVEAIIEGSNAVEVLSFDRYHFDLIY
jgi:hypothetical protein